jgi:hypothetical protein
MTKELKESLYAKAIVALKVFIVLTLFFGLIAYCTEKDKKSSRDLKIQVQQSNKLSDYAEIVDKTGDEIHVELYYNNLGGNDLLVLGSNVCEYVFEKLQNSNIEQKILKVIATANVTTEDSYGNRETKKDKILIAYWNMDDVKKFNCQNHPDIFEKTITNPKLFKNEVIVTSDFYWKLRKECEKGARNMGICNKMVVKNPNSF